MQYKRAHRRCNAVNRRKQAQQQQRQSQAAAPKAAQYRQACKLSKPCWAPLKRSNHAAVTTKTLNNRRKPLGLLVASARSGRIKRKAMQRCMQSPKSPFALDRSATDRQNGHLCRSSAGKR